MVLHAGKIHYATEQVLKRKPRDEGQRMIVQIPPPDEVMFVASAEGAKPPSEHLKIEVVEFEALYHYVGKKRVLTWWLLT